MATPVYPLDLTGIAQTNSILEERHLPNEAMFHNRAFIIPFAAPFFAASCVLKYTPTDGLQRVLLLDEEYSFALPCLAASQIAEQPLFGAFVLTPPLQNGLLYISYQTLGGGWVAHQTVVIARLSQTRYNPLITIWDELVFPPICVPGISPDSPECTPGSYETAAALVDIAAAITEQTTGATVINHLMDFNNPHQLSLATFGHAFAEDADLAPTSDALIQLRQCFLLLDTTLPDLEDTPLVVQPSIITPSQDTIKRTATVLFEGSVFLTQGGDSTHESSYWQLALDANFTHFVKTDVVPAPSRQWVVDSLNENTVYYGRVCYKNTSGVYSAWSLPVRFETKTLLSLQTPSVLSPVSGAVEQPIDLTFSCSDFAVINGIDTHVCSEWVLAADITFVELVKTEIVFTGDLTQWVVTGLLNNRQYAVRVRQLGSIIGASNWSTGRVFTTIPACVVVTPTITAPTDGAVDVTQPLTITGSVYHTNYGTDPHSQTTWQLTRDPTWGVVDLSVTDLTPTTTWVLNTLLSETAYFVRVQYQSENGLSSAWSAACGFVTQHALVIEQPTITTPEEGAVLTATAVAFEATEFSTQYGSDTHASSDWQLATDAAFTTLVDESLNNTISKTTWGVTDLDADTPYYLRVRYTGDSETVSEWSLPASFTIALETNSIPTTEIAKLTASNGSDNDRFGVAVALSENGRFACIGAPLFDVVDMDDDCTGAAYIFVCGNDKIWTEQMQLMDSDGGPNDYFGQKVALSADGQTACVSAPTDYTTQGYYGGSVSIFTYTDPVWSQQAKIVPVDGLENAQFGYSVALSADGNVVCIGAATSDTPSGYSAGYVYIYTRGGGVWTQQAKLTAGDAAEGDWFGSSVALSADGQTACIGASNDSGVAGSHIGSAYIFTQTGGVWSQQAKLTAADGGADDQFGTSVALSADGQTACIGAVGNIPASFFTPVGASYIFKNTGGVWTEQAKLTEPTAVSYDLFGYSVSLSSDGRSVYIGAPNGDVETESDRGYVSVFTETAGVWSKHTQLFAIDGVASDSFGCSVALSRDNQTALISSRLHSPGGLYTAGAAYVFR